MTHPDIAVPSSRVEVTIDNTPPKQQQASAVDWLPRVHRDLYESRQGNQSLLQHVMAKAAPDAAATSTQETTPGRKDHPLDREACKKLIQANVHHQTCIKTKVAATVGIGFRDPSRKEGEPRDPFKETKEDKALNPLCEISIANVLSDVCEDFCGPGEGYMEVVREKPGGRITGLYHMASEHVFKVIEEDGDHHYEVLNTDSYAQKKYPYFGDAEDFIKRAGNRNIQIGDLTADGRVSEIISFPMPTSLSRWYGFPDWLAAVAAIELVQAMDQDTFDFFLNRGVPEFLLFIIGQKMEDGDWTRITNSLKANVGGGNAHKSGVFNLIASPDAVKVELLKLAMEARKEDFFSNTQDSLAMRIVSAHRTPPLLAGILIPGKLGATNELPNALRAYQCLTIDQYQRLFKQRLATTLGNPGKNGDLDLGPDDFNFNKITDEINLVEMDTSARMREPEASARARGRDMSAGVKD